MTFVCVSALIKAASSDKNLLSPSFFSLRAHHRAKTQQEQRVLSLFGTRKRTTMTDVTDEPAINHRPQIGAQLNGVSLMLE